MKLSSTIHLILNIILLLFVVFILPSLVNYFYNLSKTNKPIVIDPISKADHLMYQEWKPQPTIMGDKALYHNIDGNATAIGCSARYYDKLSMNKSGKQNIGFNCDSMYTNTGLTNIGCEIVPIVRTVLGPK